MFDIKTEMPINPFRLDEEVLDQGRKMMSIIEASADAQQQRDRAKLRTEVVYASLSHQVRTNPTKFGIKGDKPSDKTVDNIVTSHPHYIKARQRLINLQRDFELLKDGVKAFQDRSIQIGRMIQLFLTGYFGQEAKIPADCAKEMDKRTEEQQRHLLEQNPRMQRMQRTEVED